MLAKLLDCLKNTYTDLQFLPIWVIALNVLPAFVMSNMQPFLTHSVGFSVTFAAVIVNAHDAFSGISAIIGAFLGDVYLTEYAIIFLSSLSYLCGLILLTFVHMSLRPDPNDKDADIIISRCLVGVGLLLVSLGNFSLTNSAHNLSGITTRRDDDDGTEMTPDKKRISNAQNLIKYSVKAIVLIVSILVPGWYTRENDKDGILLHAPRRRFLYPAISMGLITIVSLYYLKNNSFRKPTVDRWTLLNLVPRTFINFMRKYLLREEAKSWIDNRFLEQSEIRKTKPSEERRVSLRRHESFYAITTAKGGKRLLGMVSMCLAFLAYGLVKSIGDTFFLEQASDMCDGDIVPVQAFIYLTMASSLLTIYLYKKMISDKLPQPAGEKYSPAIEYAMGMVLSALCCTIASWVATSQYQHNNEKNKNMSVFRLTPQFVFFGAMDGLAGEGIEQFFSKHLPRSIMHYAHVFTQGIIGAGLVFGITLVLVTKAASSWFNENNLRLDKFYHLLTVVGIGIFFGYTLVAVKYPYQDIEEEPQVEDQNQHENGNEVRIKLNQRENGNEEPKHVQNTLISH